MSVVFRPQIQIQNEEEEEKKKKEGSSLVCVSNACSHTFLIHHPLHSTGNDENVFRIVNFGIHPTTTTRTTRQKKTLREGQTKTHTHTASTADGRPKGPRPSRLGDDDGGRQKQKQKKQKKKQNLISIDFLKGFSFGVHYEPRKTYKLV